MRGVRLTFYILINSIFMIGCQSEDIPLVDNGVSNELAQYRLDQVETIDYELSLVIPADCKDTISGKVKIIANLKHLKSDLIIDFVGSSESIKDIHLGEEKVDYTFKDGHIIVNKDVLQESSEIVIDFSVPDGGLVRYHDYIYSSFVPNKASSCFPVLDQPSIKSKFKLDLEVPSEWISVSNSSIQDTLGQEKGRVLYRFSETELISPYMFFFGAGKMEVSEPWKENNIRTYNIGSDDIEGKQLIEELSTIHGNCLNWMQDYTGINYPFPKTDVILLPDFYLGGMEYPGITAFQTASIKGLLEDRTLERLSSVELVAHEMAHMWIGNYTSIDWYDDIWLKEGLAGYLAIKYLESIIPHDELIQYLLLSKYRDSQKLSYHVGSTPLYQEIQNSNLVGSVYTANTYSRAPLAFFELEHSLGEKVLQNSIQVLIKDNAYGFINWKDLKFNIITKSPVDVETWYSNWIVSISESELFIKRKAIEKVYFDSGLEDIEDPLQRSIIWSNWFENFLTRKTTANDFFKTCIREVVSERNTQLVSYINDLIKEVYWQHLTSEQQIYFAPKIEAILINLLINTEQSELRAIYFDTFLSIASTGQSIQILYNLWANKIELVNSFSDTDNINMALNLAIRDSIQITHLFEVENSKQYSGQSKEYINFLFDVISDRKNSIKNLFDKGCISANELWVNDALKFLFHPANETKEVDDIEIILDLLIENNQNEILILEDRIGIALHGYSSHEAYLEIEKYLSNHRELPIYIQNIILRSSNHLYRLYDEKGLL